MYSHISPCPATFKGDALNKRFYNLEFYQGSITVVQKVLVFIENYLIHNRKEFYICFEINSYNIRVGKMYQVTDFVGKLQGGSLGQWLLLAHRFQVKMCTNH